MKNLTRRNFLQTSIIGAAGLSMLPLFNSCKTGASDTIRMGVIGLGRQSVFLINGFNTIPGIKIVAGCDVYGVKRQRFEMMVKSHQAAKNETIEVVTYDNYKAILERTDIDAVIIATPDHWHAIIAIDACKAGKDIYLEKPLVFTIKEGIELCKTVRGNNIVLGVGSQQRSDKNFQHVRKMVQAGKIGQLEKINAWVGPPANPYDLPEEQIPADLDWDKWLGPNPYVHYNSKLNPPISLDPLEHEKFWANWRYYKETGGGFLTDWGAHNLDQASWILDKDNGGPVKIIPAGHDGYDFITFEYENGVIVSNEPFTEDKNFGVKCWGSDGWLEVSRNHIAASDDSLLPSKEAEGEGGVPYETGTPHLNNFIEAVKTRTDTIAPVEAGHRSGSLGILGNIATNLDRPLGWDPVNQTFVDDTEADTFLHREYREGYKL